jgi:hypothetical protein
MKCVRPMHACVGFVLAFMLVGVTASSASTHPDLPPNDDFANATDLGSAMTASASGSNLWATAEPGEPRQISGPAMVSVWYRWTAPQSGVVAVETCGSDFDTTLAVFRGVALRDLGRVAANDNACRNRSALRFLGISGTSYYIAVGGRRGAQRSIELRIRSLIPPRNDDFADAIDLGNRLTAAASGTNRDATIEPREPDHAGTGTVGSVWYRWTAPSSRRIRIETCGSGFDTVIGVYAGPRLDTLSTVVSNDDGCGTRSRVMFNSKAGTTYRIAVAGFAADEGTFRLKLAKREKRRRTPEPERV